MRILDITNDSDLFADAPSPEHVPMYEPKLIHQFDHRWATYENGRTRDLADSEKESPSLSVRTRWWAPQVEVDERIADRWERDWLLCWRDIARSTDVRTLIAAIIPRVAVGNSAPIMFPADEESSTVAALYGNLNSFALDYVARQKAGGTNLNYFIIKQLPILPPSTYDLATPWQADKMVRDWIADRVLELSYTAWDLQPFAQDLGYDGPPFKWDVERRFEVRCELDAAYFHLYEIERNDVDYIMSTFPIVQRKDEAAHGTYRTRDRILEIYDAMASGEWLSALDPPVADPRAAHPA